MIRCNNTHKTVGFTLIEVLLALMIIAIALTALVRSTSQNVVGTVHIKDKAVSHWIAMQGVTMIQLGLIDIVPNQEITKVTRMLNQRWYWRVKLTPTPLTHVLKITISTSQKQSGPFHETLIAFRYTP